MVLVILKLYTSNKLTLKLELNVKIDTNCGELIGTTHTRWLGIHMIIDTNWWSIFSNKKEVSLKHNFAYMNKISFFCIVCHADIALISVGT